MLDPEKPRAKGAEEPFVTGADDEIGAKLRDIHGNGAAALAHIEQQQSPLRVARGGNAFGVEQRPVVEAHEAHGDQARVGSQRGDEIIRAEESLAWRNDFYF